MRVPLPQSTAISFARASAASGSRVARSGVSRVRRVPNANASTPRAGPHDRVQVEEQRPRVRVHRARDVAEHDELARDGLARLPRLLDRLAAGAQRPAAEPPQVEHVAARVGRAATRHAARPRARDRGHELAHALELLGRHLGEVLLAQELVPGRAELVRRVGVVRLVAVRARLERVAGDAVGPAPRLLLADERRDRAAQEPRDERAIEELELVVARDERLAQREVDVVLPREIDGVEPAHRVGDAPRPDLDPDLAQHAAEGHDVPDDRGALHPRLPVRGRARLFDEADERLVAHGLDVLAVLQHRAERLLDDLGVDLLAPERGERLRPVDRLGDAGRLREVERAQAADERGGLLREPLGDPGDAQRTISTSRSIDGCPIQWKSARRLSASCSSRVRFEVRITAGLRRARIVPSSGIVIWKSESTSSRNASNSSSARSISSMSRTTGSSESIASSSGRRMRNSGPKSSSSETVPSCAARMWRSCRG